MPRATATRHGFGRAARAFHWLCALAIVAAAALGLYMLRLPAGSETEVAAVYRAFSAHKTLGIVALALILARLGWTLRHPGPGPLHPARRVETFLADLVHWILWGAMLALPVTGWLHHSAAPGFAPILWPFGQSLPLVSADEARALEWRTLHRAASWLLYGALALHILGALKHALVDRDATLARMVTGNGPPVAPARAGRYAAILAAALWTATIAVSLRLAPEPEPDPFGALNGLDSLDGIDGFGEPVLPGSAPLQ
ncbi:cytochrome b/b6 domain-containing protein [Defluviimonas sp. WL0024]|uniref:Cytochrome b/b6 domain-containing protein n=1 Tax=Albidovulum salinarum TaxID=2984153 RepID=A0ABT2X461_9RHOB|nr:cytochrome b/b6 domain-containing protein [Defluviimonas sp. WL0024]MCU9848731.1 cytochrome b/b6 domain-containing protein [Defluviimonas sp. WL0024]